MFRTLKALFEDRIAGYALLFEISRADHEVHEEEHSEMVRAVSTVCGLDESDIASLLETADDAVEQAVSLYDFTSVVNEHLNREKKYELLLLLWRIAYADGRLDRYEEYYIRKIADLMHLSHADFIRAKHAAAD
jgi:uncharacterized tellurite resistance protein B-like protein